MNLRTSLIPTLSTWHALFLREAVILLTAKRTSLLGTFLQPISQIILLVMIYTFIRQRQVSGIDLELWIIGGVLSYYFFGDPARKALSSVGGAAALYTYRQVIPIDAVIVKAAIEGLILMVVAALLVIFSLPFEVIPIPSAPLELILAIIGLWLLGLGVGLILSIIVALIPEANKLFSTLFRAVYVASGAIFPLHLVPSQFLYLVDYNPVTHGIEIVRHSMANYYHPAIEPDLLYLYSCAGITIIIGTFLHVSLHERAVAQ